MPVVAGPQQVQPAMAPTEMARQAEAHLQAAGIADGGWLPCTTGATMVKVLVAIRPEDMDVMRRVFGEFAGSNRS